MVGTDIREWAKPFVVGVKQPMEHWCIAIDKVRYAGEPVAVVVAENRYVAEDAMELIAELDDEAEANVVSSWGPYMTTSGTAKKTAVPGLTAPSAL